ncbi:MAG: hypothetical protein GY757_15525 [bacterium]|nr:hypothetical protein [bacterium]
MKKVMKVILILLVLLILSYTVFNLFDSDLHPNAYSAADLPPTSFEKTNGYFYIWGLSEPDGVEVLSDEYIRELRHIFDTTLSPADARERFQKFDTTKYREQFSKSKTNKIISKISFADRFSKDWISELAPQQKQIDDAQLAAPVLLKRYRLLIAAPECRDFSAFNFEAPIPNFLALLKTAKLYTALCTQKAVSGQWVEGVNDLLAQIYFSRRATTFSRSLITNHIAKACTTISLQGLLSIINHSECPASLYPLILSGMTPLEYPEYGNRNAYIGEYLTLSTTVDMPLESKDFSDTILRFLPISIFLHKNRTKNTFYRVYSGMIAFDGQEPFRWDRDPTVEFEKELEWKKPFWWLRNPIGRLFSAIALPNLQTAIFRGYRVRALYDMTRIAAELQLNYSPGQKVENILKDLDSYKALDPFSGKPYIWHPRKKLLYSFGMDKKDNDGVVTRSNFRKTDVAIPVVLTSFSNKKEEPQKPVH